MSAVDPTPEQPRQRRWPWLVGVPLGLLLVAVASLVGVWVTATVDTVGEVEFDRPLAVPPLAESRVDEQGRRVFDLTLQQGETDLGRAEPTETWGINGSYLGPTLRAMRGEQVLVNVTNELGETSTLHWHGMHLPAAMDGGPHQKIGTGATWSPTWQIDQPAATLWYHPHQKGSTAEHVYRGVAGMFLIDDEQSAGLSLPQEYGVDDFPVIVQDKSYDGHELSFDEAFLGGVGILGDQILVNGTPGPYLDVTTERVRLRLLNASNARPYNFHFADEREYDVIASDGGLLPEPVPRRTLALSPGERAEIVVDVEAGETTVLRSGPLDTDVGFPGDLQARFSGHQDRFDVLQLRAADELASSPAVPATLATPPDLDAAEVSETREFTMANMAINGEKMDMARIDVEVPLGATERWRVHAADSAHNFHVHDVQFVIESIDGEPPPPHLAGWKDTVFLAQGSEAHLLLRFTDYADPETPYMYHCHILMHEDMGMMGQFVVVDR